MVQIHEVEQVDRHQLSRHRGRRSRRLPRKQVKKCRAEGLLYKKVEIDRDRYRFRVLTCQGQNRESISIGVNCRDPPT